jgi:nicotinate-nucleotide pyrophosphorylase
MRNRYYVRLKLYKDNLEMPLHNKVVSVIIEADDKEQVREIIDVTHAIMVCDKVDYDTYSYLVKRRSK